MTFEVVSGGYQIVRRMRFYLGETYESDSPDGPRQAVVVGLAEQGRQAILRLIDTGEECVVLWAELHRVEKWRRSHSLEVSDQLK